MEWWNKDIDNQTAVSFLKECQDYTQKAIQNDQPDIKAYRFSHKIPPSAIPFIPFGAIIQTTRTRTIWDALRVIGSEAYGSHFIIASHKGISSKEFDLLSRLPASIFMPMGWESAVPHAAHMSTVTWGIDLRNVGKVRPWYSPISSEPTPIFVGEESANMFKHPHQSEPQFYWWDNLWRSKFKGHTEKWFDFYYEVPSFSQIKTLIILLRVLNAIQPLESRSVIPASCIRNIEPVAPHIPWELVRHFVFHSPNEEPTISDFNHIIKKPKSYGDFENTYFNDIFTTDNAKLQQWRSENDDGMLHFILNGPNVDFSGTRYGLKTRFVDDIRILGYDTDDIDYAARLYVAAHNMHPDRLNDVVVACNKKVKKLQG
jgi:hypothetical protein